MYKNSICLSKSICKHVYTSRYVHLCACVYIYSRPLNNVVLGCWCLHSWKCCDSPKTSVIPVIHKGLVPKLPPLPTSYQNLQMLKKWHGMARKNAYGQPFAFVDYQLWTKNTVSNLWLAESTNPKPMDMESWLYSYIYWKESTLSGPT